MSLSGKNVWLWTGRPAGKDYLYGTGLAYIVKAKFPQKSLKPTFWRAASGLHEVKTKTKKLF